jgi:thiosulfate dehydrogenase
MVAVSAFTSGQMVRPETAEKPRGPIGGRVLFEFDRTALTALGLELVVNGDGDSEEAGPRFSSVIQSTSTLDVERVDGVFNDVSTARIGTHGAVLFTDGKRRVVFGNFTITKEAGGLWTVRDGLNEDPAGRIVFEFSSVTIDAPAGRQEMRIAGELAIAESLADELDLAQASGTAIGRVLITAQPVGAEQAPLDAAQAVLAQTEDVDNTAMAIGPDVIVGDLYELANYGSLGGISAFAVGTVSCNIGDFWLNWISNSNQHPVIGQGMFRLKNNRFEQVGQSWIKHGFFALSQSLCFSDCQSTSGSHLGVHCSDPYSASLNGTQSNMGPKYQVDADTGYFPYPSANPPYSGNIARRLQVRNSDLDPSLNGGGLYFVEGQYITSDDAAAGNQNNNAAYRRVTVSGSGGSWTIALAGATQRQQAAIRAWKDTDPTVTETDVQVPGEGLFIVSAKATDLGTGYWHYEYAVQNLNSHRSARAFSVPVDPAGEILNIGFHDVDYHSGETWLGADWNPIVQNGSITWSTDDYSVDPNANALRWGTLYNFRFDANRSPQAASATLVLFRPGTPTEAAANTIGPMMGPVCGNNVVETGEQCDDGNTLSGDGCSATCQLEIGPPNDHCANALSVGDGIFAFNTGGADTDGPNESALCNVGMSSVESDVWYCYTSPCTGTATASLCGSVYDTMLAVYDGCTCPTTASARDCDNDTCGLQSVISFPATACDQYLMRVGGYQAAQGSGSLTLSCQPDPIVNDCNANGVDDATDIACGTTADNNGNGIPDICEVIDYIRGGRMYDRWWTAIAAPAPTTDHLLWQYRPDPTSDTATGSTTWRCTECHGWDYKGVDGEYAAGPHRTGFPGVFGTALAPAAMFNLLHEPPNNGGGGGVPNGHDYGSVLTNEQLNDLVAFVLDGVIDTDTYVNSAAGGIFLGDQVAGEMHYRTGGTLSQCISCHGDSGAAINFGTPQAPEYLGTIAVYEPFHFLHRTRMGFPGTPMQGWLANGGTDQGVADIGRYVQLNFPVDCLDASQCDDGLTCTDDSCDANGRCVFTVNDTLCPDDGVFCNGTEICTAESGCADSGNPCFMPDLCDEVTASCGCEAPLVVAAGPRYLAITPQGSAASSPMRLLVTPNCPLGVGKYLGAPSGTYHVASPLDNPNGAAILMPSQWGETVYVTGVDIVPGMEYQVQADCGLTGRPVVTAAAVVRTPIWGDVVGWLPGGIRTPPDGVVDAIDIVSIVDTLKGATGALPMYAVDLYGCIPDQVINAIDVVGGVDAFKGFAYPQASCSGPCR